MRKTTALALTILITVFVFCTVSVAQPGGDIVAGQISPWRNAHFVILAYGAVWVGLALYVLRLAMLARSLRRELSALEELASDSE
jgi:CcmD family protein